MAILPVFLPGESHGQRSLVGCRPWVEESPTRPSTHHMHRLEDGLDESLMPENIRKSFTQ